MLSTPIPVTPCMSTCLQLVGRMYGVMYLKSKKKFPAFQPSHKEVHRAASFIAQNGLHFFSGHQFDDFSEIQPLLCLGQQLRSIASQIPYPPPNWDPQLGQLWGGQLGGGTPFLKGHSLGRSLGLFLGRNLAGTPMGQLGGLDGSTSLVVLPFP